MSFLYKGIEGEADAAETEAGAEGSSGSRRKKRFHLLFFDIGHMVGNWFKNVVLQRPAGIRHTMDEAAAACLRIPDGTALRERMDGSAAQGSA